MIWERSQTAVTERMLGGPASVTVSVSEPNQVGEARRAAALLASRAGLSETERGALAIVVTEAATNLAHHARDGVLVLRALGAPEAGGVEVLALDKGPGIRDLSRAMSDGYSTSGTAGHGLGAIRRMASEFDLSSSTDAGTALLARVWSASADKRRDGPAGLEGTVCVPVKGETACGDGWAVFRDGARTIVVLADGLGHGSEAARAADEALRVVREHLAESPAQIVQRVHGALRATRGAAIAVAEITDAPRGVRFAGVGNVVSAIVSTEGMRSLASVNGTAGHAVRTVQEFTYAWPPGACLVMHSDGLTSRWRLDAYPGLVGRHPALVAGVLYRDFTRGRDDATVIAVRTGQGER